MEDQTFADYGISPSHPLLNQRKTLELLENRIKSSQNSSYLATWNEFTSHFKVTAMTDAINKKKSSRILILHCSEEIRNLIEPSDENDFSLPNSVIGHMCVQLLKSNSIPFDVYQGTVENFYIHLVKLFSTATFNNELSAQQINFARSLLLDQNVEVFELSETSTEYFNSLCLNRGSLFQKLQTLPNLIIDSESSTWKMLNLLTGFMFTTSMADHNHLLYHQEYFVSIYDSNWIYYFLILLKLTSYSKYYLQLFFQIISSLLSLPQVFLLPGFIESLVEPLMSCRFILPLLTDYVEPAVKNEDQNFPQMMIYKQERAERETPLMISTLNFLGLISRYSEVYASFLTQNNILAILLKIVIKWIPKSHLTTHPVFYLLQAITSFAQNSLDRQQILIEEGIVDCLDRCLLRFGEELRSELIVLSDILQIKPNKYLRQQPNWLLIPYPPSFSRGDLNANSKIPNSDEKNIEEGDSDPKLSQSSQELLTADHDIPDISKITTNRTKTYRAKKGVPNNNKETPQMSKPNSQQFSPKSLLQKRTVKNSKEILTKSVLSKLPSSNSSFKLMFANFKKYHNGHGHKIKSPGRPLPHHTAVATKNIPAQSKHAIRFQLGSSINQETWPKKYLKKTSISHWHPRPLSKPTSPKKRFFYNPISCSSDPAWNSIDRGDWWVVSEDIDVHVGKVFTEQEMERMRSVISKKLAKRCKTYEADTIKFCLNKWVELMELNSLLISQASEESYVLQQTQSHIKGLSYTLGKVWSQIKTMKKEPQDSETSNVEEFKIVKAFPNSEDFTKKMSIHENDHPSPSPSLADADGGGSNRDENHVSWWWLSGNTCHLSHLSSLPALTEKQVKIQQQLFAQFEKKYPQKSNQLNEKDQDPPINKFREFGSKWSKEGIKLTENITWLEFIQSKTIIDLENLRLFYRNHPHDPHQDMKIHLQRLFQATASVSRVYHKSAMKHTLLKQELQILGNYKKISQMNMSYFEDSFTPSQLGRGNNLLKLIDAFERNVAMVCESSLSETIELLTLYIWLTSHSESTYRLEWDISLRSFSKQLLRHEKFSLLLLRNQVSVKISLLQQLQSLERFTERQSLIVNEISHELYLQIPSLWLPLVSKESYFRLEQLQALLRCIVYYQKIYVNEKLRLLHEQRGMNDLLRIEDSFHDLITVTSFYQYLCISNNFSAFPFVGALNPPQIYECIQNQVSTLSRSNKALFKHRYYSKTWYSIPHFQSHEETLRPILTTAPSSAPAVAVPHRTRHCSKSFPPNNERMIVLRDCKNLSDIILFLSELITQPLPLPENESSFLKLGHVGRVMGELVSNFIQSHPSLPSNFLPRAFYKIWVKDVGFNRNLPKLHLNADKGRAVRHESLTISESGMAILSSFSLLHLHCEKIENSFVLNTSLFFSFCVEILRSCFCFNLSQERESFKEFLENVMTFSIACKRSHLIIQSLSWTDCFEIVILAILQSLLMIFHDPSLLSSVHCPPLIVPDELIKYLISILKETVSFELYLFTIHVLDVMCYQNLNNLNQLLSHGDGFEFNKLLSQALTISRVVYEKQETNSKQKHVIYNFNHQTCNFLFHVSQIAPKRTINKLVSNGLMTDIAAAMSMFSCHCPAFIRQNLILNPTNKENNTKKTTKKYLNPLEISLNPPIRGFIVVIQKMSDLATSTTSQSKLRSVPPKKPKSPSKKLQMTDSEDEEGKESKAVECYSFEEEKCPTFLEAVDGANDEEEDEDIQLLTAKDATIEKLTPLKEFPQPLKYETETVISVKNGVFSLPSGEDGIYSVKILTDTTPAIYLSKYTVKVSDGFVERKSKVLNSKASDVQNAFCDDNKPHSSSTIVTDNFITTGSASIVELSQPSPPPLLSLHHSSSNEVLEILQKNETDVASEAMMTLNSSQETNEIIQHLASSSHDQYSQFQDQGPVNTPLTMPLQSLTGVNDIPHTFLLLPRVIAQFLQQSFHPHDEENYNFDQENYNIEEEGEGDGENEENYLKINKSSIQNLLKSGNIFEEELFLFFVSSVSGRIASTNHGSGFKIKIPTQSGQYPTPFFKFTEALLRVSLFSLSVGMGMPGPASVAMSCVPFPLNSFHYEDYSKRLNEGDSIQQILERNNLEENEGQETRNFLETQNYQEIVEKFELSFQKMQLQTTKGIILQHIPRVGVSHDEYQHLLQLLSLIDPTSSTPLALSLTTSLPSSSSSTVNESENCHDPLAALGRLLTVQNSGLIKVMRDNGKVDWLLPDEE